VSTGVGDDLAGAQATGAPVAVVTGAARGIGAGLAVYLAGRGTGPSRRPVPMW
jgi:hypothetical protein